VTPERLQTLIPPGAPPGRGASTPAVEGAAGAAPKTSRFFLMRGETIDAARQLLPPPALVVSSAVRCLDLFRRQD